MHIKIVVIGSTDGLGLAILKQLPSGFFPLLWGRDQPKTESIARQLSLPFVVCDIRDYGQVESALGQASQILNGIDIVINCVGIWTQGDLQDLPPSLIYDVMHTNAIGSLWIARAAFPFLSASSNNPLLVNVISEDGLTIKPHKSVYTASKWAMTGLTKSLALDWQSHGIRVCGVYPGPFKSNLFQKAGVDRDFSTSHDVEYMAQQIVKLVSQPQAFSEELILT